MNEYGFNRNKEYKKYNSIIKLKRKDQNYLTWKNNLLKPYREVNDKDFFINFIKWLEVYKRREEIYMKIFSSFVLPLIVVSFSFFPSMSSSLVSSSQWQDAIQIRIDSELINGGSKQPSESLQESVDKFRDSNNCAYAILYTGIFSIVAFLVSLPWLAYICLKKIDFYNDCQKIIKERLQEI